MQSFQDPRQLRLDLYTHICVAGAPSRGKGHFESAKLSMSSLVGCRSQLTPRDWSTEQDLLHGLQGSKSTERWRFFITVK
jgi:hypothetical protein